MRSCLQNLWTRYLIVVSLLALVLLHQAFNSYLTAQRSARSSMADAPLFTFALMTDLQYADKVLMLNADRPAGHACLNSCTTTACASCMRSTCTCP